MNLEYLKLILDNIINHNLIKDIHFMIMGIPFINRISIDIKNTFRKYQKCHIKIFKAKW